MNYGTTTRDLALYFNPGGIMTRTVNVPAGARCERLHLASTKAAPVWVLCNPTSYAAGDAILAHDLEHHYLVIPDDSVELDA